MLRTIRSRIAVPYVILILVTMLGLGVFISYFLRQIYLDNLNSQLFTQVRMVGEAIELNPDLVTDPELVDDLVAKWSDILGTRLTIIAADGVVLGDSHTDPENMENHRNRPEISQAISSGEGFSTRFSRTTGYQTIYTAVSVPIDIQNEIIVRVSFPLDQAQAEITLLLNTFMGTTLIVSIIAVLLAIIIADNTTRPIRDTTKAISQFANEELKEEITTSRIEPTTITEIAQLIMAFNSMAVQLHQQVKTIEAERGTILAILQEMTDGVITVNQHGRIEMLNPAAENVFGVSQDSISGNTLAEGIRFHQVVELWQSCLNTGKTQYAMLEISTTRQYLQGVATPLEQPTPDSVLLLFQNITRQRYLETVRRDFISNISHELRTPLASIKALTETLQDSALDDPPAARRFLQRMDMEVDAVTQIVAELLELSRIESGKVPFQMRPTRPDDILYPAVERLRFRAERSDLSITVDCPTGLPAILADQTRLEQAIVNLLHNAIKFTSSGGKIALKANLWSEKEQNENKILFSVSDTGIGIATDDLPRIFERFYKADRARSSGGTGLGLAIARHTVDAHNGKIWAESIERQGSTFYFYIPLAS